MTEPTGTARAAILEGVIAVLDARLTTAQADLASALAELTTAQAEIGRLRAEVERRRRWAGAWRAAAEEYRPERARRIWLEQIRRRDARMLDRAEREWGAEQDRMRAQERELRSELERARAALRFYADGEHVETWYGNDSRARVAIDQGERARAALGEEADHG